MNISNNELGIYTNTHVPVAKTIILPIYPKEKSDKFSKQTTTNPNAGFSNKNLFNLYNPRLILKTYIAPDNVKSLVEKNPKIKDILKEKGIEYKIHPENISSIMNSHLRTTTAYALQIANTMNLSAIDKKYLEQASIFHDFGKLLIPKEIINLTPDEREKIDLHAQLGYELLSQTNMDKRVLNIIKNHHTPYTQNKDTLSNVLSVADIYSALREERSYKKPLTIEESFKILDQKAQQGEVSTEVVNALKTAINKSYAAA